MSDKKIDVAFVSRDSDLGALIGVHRPAGQRLMRVAPASGAAARLRKARQWWIDLDCMDSPPFGLCERRVYFYSTLPAGADDLPPGLFIPKPVTATVVQALWNDCTVARPALAPPRFQEDRLPAWLLEYHELDVRKLCHRSVARLPERFGYAGMAFYAADRERKTLNLLETSFVDPIDFSVRLDAADTDLLAAAIAGGRPIITNDVADHAVRRGLRGPEQRPVPPATAGLLAPLTMGGDSVGILYFRGRRHTAATEVGLPIEPVCNFLARCLKAAQMYELARAEARLDCLTGLFNYRWMIESVALEIERAKRFDFPLSLVLVDLDGMKGVNDAHGHQAGDALLCHVAGKIRGVLRQIDSAARVGGDEFIILLPGTDYDGAQKMAERLLSTLRMDGATIGGGVVPVGASVGIAEWRPNWSARELFDAADAAMYRAKRLGRGCVAPRCDVEAPAPVATPLPRSA